MKAYKNDVPVKQQPKHMVEAEKFTVEILSKFNEEQQNDMIKHIKNKLIESRHRRISDLKNEISFYESCIEVLEE